MRILGIDGALDVFSAALLDTAEPGQARTALADGGDALERGMWTIEEVLGPPGIAAVERIAVGVGPGSFTGLRIALSYAKGLAFAAHLPLVGISSYDALEPAGPALPLLTVVSGRVGIACVRLQRRGKPPVQRCGTYEELASFVAEHLEPGTVSCAGPSEGVAPRLGERGFTVRAYPSAIEPAALAIASLAAAREAAPSPHAVLADYGEQPAAVVRAEQDAR
jgi:tRNA threonylcarbamoyladenosine biosynthesis protein TsaB